MNKKQEELIEPIAPTISEKEKRAIQTYKCPECDAEFNLQSLRIHYSKLHKKTSRELAAILFHNGIQPTCKCGCGGEVYFFSLIVGFGSYVKGHHVREYEKNPWNKKLGINAKKKSNETKMKLYKEGKFKFFDGKEPWNKGKVKATDPEYAAKITFTDTEEFKEKQRAIIFKNKKNGKMISPKGEKSYVWKGGISPLNNVCRSSPRLYKEWTYPILKNNNFKCSGCNIADGKLEVHHDKETFSSILRKIAKENGWLEKHFLNEKLNNPDKETLELKEKISNLIVDYHVFNNVSGIPLCFQCHEKLHKSYNIKK